MNKDRIERVGVRASLSKKDLKLQTRNGYRLGHFRHSRAF